MKVFVHFAVLLPYETEQPVVVDAEADNAEKAVEEIENSDNAESIPKAPELNFEEPQLIFKRHLVDQMPADGLNDMWKQLHTQVANVEFVNPNSLPMQLYPTFEVAIVWGMRLILAASVYKVLDSRLYPFYKMKNPNDRPVTRRPKLSNTENAELGALGQSRWGFLPLCHLSVS